MPGFFVARLRQAPPQDWSIAKLFCVEMGPVPAEERVRLFRCYITEK